VEKLVVGFTPRPAYPRGKAYGTHWIGDLVSPRAGLDHMEKNSTKYLFSRYAKLQSRVIPFPFSLRHFFWPVIRVIV
jgi:hypothetical protein